ncbi:MAG: hypothetical protein JNK25_11730 [Phycisphaerae bacterium]|nr:hypothetical protein [Phycisphaerae bacterium]
MALTGVRGRAGLYTFITTIAVTAAAVVGISLGGRYNARFDVTATGSQRLADRTKKVLGLLTGQYEAVIAADFTTIDRRAKERLSDVLEEFRRNSSRFNYTLIDTSTSAGAAAYKDLIRRLIAREADTIRQQVAAIELHLGAVTSLATNLSDVVSPRLLDIEGQVPAATDAGKANRDFFTQEAARARLAAKDLSTAAEKAAAAIGHVIDGVPVALTDEAANAITAQLSPIVEQLAALAGELRRFGEVPDNAGPAADSAKSLISQVQQRRDQAAVVLDSLRKLRPPDLLRVVSALRSGSAAIVIGPPGEGLCALDVTALLPSGAWLDAVGAAKADQRRRVEELFATAIQSLRNPLRPVVVMLHAEPREFFADVPLLSLLRQRLEFRGIDLVEWAVVVRPDPPRLSSIDPEGKRPVVYASLAPDSSASAGSRGQLTGVQRAEKLAQALDRIAAEGGNLLMSLNPSIVPTYGERDPMESVLARFALTSETGRPLLRESLAAGNRTIDTDVIVQVEDEGAHPVAAAIRGLPTYIAWPIALVEKHAAADPTRVTVTPLLTVPAGPNLWLESQWLRIWQTPREQRSLLADAAKFDEGRDSRWPGGADQGGAVQRWVIAAASERFLTGRPSQRAVIIGSNSWFIDPVTSRLTAVEGRRVPANPGNLELFENAVYWLAGQTELIAQSPVAQAAPMILPIGESQAMRLRLALILGMPLLALLGGALVRLIRG